jgi:Fur family iron response transcriptional regulator
MVTRTVFVQAVWIHSKRHKTASLVCFSPHRGLYIRPKTVSGIDLALKDRSTNMHQRNEIARSDVRAMLRRAGLRPTRQRLALAEILFARGNRHISAETLHEEALIRKVPVSLATIYNSLHQFTGVGLLREVAVDGSKTYFDTNTSDHDHFFVEDDNEVIDIPDGQLGVGRVPDPPPGYEITRIDVVVRLRRLRD